MIVIMLFTREVREAVLTRERTQVVPSVVQWGVIMGGPRYTLYRGRRYSGRHSSRGGT